MYKLKKILTTEHLYGEQGNYYDLEKDFSAFTRTMNWKNQEIKNNYEKIIGNKLNGRRIIAKSSKGYKQFIKDYEFDVKNITINNYYGNYVIIAHDTSIPKQKEYFLKPDSRITILGSADSLKIKPRAADITGNVSQKLPYENPNIAHRNDNIMSLAPAGKTPSEYPVKEQQSGFGTFDAYPIDSIIQDVRRWLPDILKKPEMSLRDFVKGLGWQKTISRGIRIAVYDLKLPADVIKPYTGIEKLKGLISRAGVDGSTISTKYELTKIEPERERGLWDIRIKKIIKDKTAR